MLADVSAAAPTSRPSARSSAVPHSGVAPFDFKMAFALPMFNGFNVPVVSAYNKSPLA